MSGSDALGKMGPKMFSNYIISITSPTCCEPSSTFVHQQNEKKNCAYVHKTTIIQFNTIVQNIKNWVKYKLLQKWWGVWGHYGSCNLQIGSGTIILSKFSNVAKKIKIKNKGKHVMDVG